MMACTVALLLGQGMEGQSNHEMLGASSLNVQMLVVMDAIPAVLLYLCNEGISICTPSHSASTCRWSNEVSQVGTQRDV